MAAHESGLTLFNLENKVRQQPKIAHEQGAGSQCARCGPKCSGFDLHYWRKICRNCRCGKENHLVTDEEDPSSRLVRLLDNPMPTSKTDGEPKSGSTTKRPTQLNFKSQGAVLTSSDGAPSSPLDWVPPSVDSQLAVKYIEQLPADQQPITGSQAAVDRKRALDRQLPSHDLDPEQCQSLTANEKRKMEEYVKNVRQFVVGQGLIQECPPRGKLPPPPPQLDRILGEKVSHLNLQPTVSKPIPQFITAKPFVKADTALTEQVRRMSAKPDAWAIHSEEILDLPPPPPELLAPSPSPPPANRANDPVRDFFDFLDEQEGKKLPGKLKSPFLHQAAASGSFNASARPFGTSPGTSPNLSQRSGATAAAGTSHHGSSPRLGAINGNQRRLLTTDFDYVPDDSKANNNHPAPPPPPPPINNKNKNNNNNNQSPLATRRPSSAAAAAGYQQEIIQQAEQQWSCRKCNLPIEAGTVAIFAERAGSDKCWHPQCFVCSICREMLADLIYFFADDDVFCGRHYAEKMEIPRCKACDELIFAPEYTSAEGASWHMDHFCCWLCDTPLAGHQYTPIEGQPHCLDCYQKKYGKDCYECGRAIRAEESRVSHGEMNWHNTASCFKCRQCQTSMMNRQFILKNGHIYCSRECLVENNNSAKAQPLLV